MFERYGWLPSCERSVSMRDEIQSGNSVQRTYKPEQIAEILGVSLRKAYNICETTNDFKVIRLGKRCIRVHKDSFDEWFNGEYGSLP